MRSRRPFATMTGLALLFCTIGLALPLPAQTEAEDAGAAPAAAAGGLRVSEFALARDYDPLTKAPVDTGSVFTPDVGKVFCYTRVVGCTDTTQVVHAWYHEGQNMAKVPLSVRSASWRTFSSKNIMPAWTGRWEVKVLDGNGAVLAARAFEVR